MFLREKYHRFLEDFEFDLIPICIVLLGVLLGVLLADCPCDEPFQRGVLFLNSLLFEIFGHTKEFEVFVEAALIEVFKLDATVILCQVIGKGFPALLGCVCPLAYNTLLSDKFFKPVE